MSRRATAARGARTIAVAGVSAAGALLLAACAPTTTTLNYDPSDGVGVSVLGADNTELRGINLLVVSAAEGEPGNVLGALSNTSAEDATFTLQSPGAGPLVVEVPAGDTVYLNSEAGEPALIDLVTAAPGDYLDATLSVGADTKEFQLPVFDGTLPEYADYVPVEVAEVVEPSASPTE